MASKAKEQAARRSYQERWLAAASLSPVLLLLPSREILFICTKGRKGNPHLSLLQREVGAALVLDIGNSHRKDTFLGRGGLYQVLECAPEAAQSAENISRDPYIEVDLGTYSVTVRLGS